MSKPAELSSVFMDLVGALCGLGSEPSDYDRIIEIVRKLKSKDQERREYINQLEKRITELEKEASSEDDTPELLMELAKKSQNLNRFNFEPLILPTPRPEVHVEARPEARTRVNFVSRPPCFAGGEPRDCGKIYAAIRGSMPAPNIPTPNIPADAFRFVSSPEDIERDFTTIRVSPGDSARY